MQGVDAPANVHPHRLRLYNKRTNHTQMMPYGSADMFKHRERYQKLLQAFDNVFAWVTKLVRVLRSSFQEAHCGYFQMADHLPDDYDVLMRLSHSLPGGYEGPVPPFLSLAINLNIRSEAHRDLMDKNICLVVPLGNFEGGELVLVEQGLVLALSSGDVVVFRSAEATHFNLDYKGERASFVLYTDQNVATWADSHNFWDGNLYFDSELSRN